MPLISVVVPVYKAEDCLMELYCRLMVSLSLVTEEFELVLVEDCGGDRSWEIIQELSFKDPRVKGLQFSRNFGQHYGITAGLEHCTGDWVVVMDCDLQDRPEEIPTLYAKAQQGYDVVLARRGQRHGSILKRTSSKLFYSVFNFLSGMHYDPQVGNYRIFSKKVLESFLQFREQLRFFGGLMEWMGFNVGSIDVKHGERFEGKSSYTIKKLFRLATETIIAYSDKPLRMVISLGLLLSFFSFIYGIYVIYRALAFGTPVEGWSSLIASIYFIGGITIGTLGLLGIYLGKVFDETKKRPLYIISNRVGL